MAIKKRSEGVYDVIIYTGSSNGKRHQKWVTVRGTHRDAIRREIELKYDQQTGGLNPTTITVGDYFDYWMQLRQPSVSPSTIVTWASHVRCHIKPTLGAIRLQKLTSAAIQDFINNLDKSPSTVRTIYRSLYNGLHWAVRWGYLSESPVKYIVLPKTGNKKPIKALTIAQSKLLLSSTKNTLWHVPIALGLFLGLRRGEICGLQWADVDINAKSVCVRQSFKQLPGKIELGPTKNGKTRNLSMPDTLVSILQQQKQLQETWSHAAGWYDNNFVCSHKTGEPLHPAAVSTGMCRIITDGSIHDLRHTHATTLLLAGVPIHVVSQRLGHASITITLDIYAHVLPSANQAAADKIDALFVE